MTVDQRGSRTDIDRVGDLLTRFADVDMVRRFERTAGDEAQAVLDDATVVARLAVELATDGHWSVGIGIGPVDEPLPASTRAGRGRAFEFARDAVESAKRRRIPVAVVGTDHRWCIHAQTAIRMLADVIAGRSAAGAEATALMRTGLSQAQAATQLGISPQAMSQRLRSASWDAEIDAYALAADLLATANSGGTP